MSVYRVRLGETRARNADGKGSCDNTFFLCVAPACVRHYHQIILKYTKMVLDKQAKLIYEDIPTWTQGLVKWELWSQ